MAISGIFVTMDAIEKVLLRKKELDALRPLDKEQEARIMQKFRLDWNYHSNHLEGNSLSFGETKALILFGITAQGKPLKDHFEITGHDEAIKWVTDIVSGDYPLTENFIRELHTLLLKEPYYKPAKSQDGTLTRRLISVGAYKTQPNHVETVTGEAFYFASPEETPAKMHDLLLWYREASEADDVNALLLAAEFHYKFIRIHPFDDGNGRTARILMNFILMRHGYPPVIIKTDDKLNYFAALRQADAGMFEPFLSYIAQNLVRSLDIMVAGGKGERIEEPDDMDKEIALLEQRLKGVATQQAGRRSKSSALATFDYSFVPLIDALANATKKFEKLYLAQEPNILVTVSNLGKSYASLADARMVITGNTTQLITSIVSRDFRQEGLGNFEFTSTIQVTLNESNILFVSGNGRLVIRKGYGDHLDGEEVKKLVESETLAHTKAINEWIAKIEAEAK